MTLEELKALPKIELHCHLDGSLSREFLESRLGRKVEPSEIHVSDDCQSLQEYLRNSIFRDSVCRTRKDWSWQGMTY